MTKQKHQVAEMTEAYGDYALLILGFIGAAATSKLLGIHGILRTV